ncbi:proline racemase family protein [Phytohabitans kaempferiae]|uniref:Proline racemase family protein n=1 Tax=Phytohabitans kaempferiae TaxID=1620943 RepID=A0ABV6MA46_9ACTN
MDSHTAGEPTRVVLHGLDAMPGATLSERSRALYARHPRLISAVVGEPRGWAPWHAVVPMPPDDPQADIAVLIFSALGPLDMCGHALIGTVTTLIEEGVVTASEPRTDLTVQTGAGLIRVAATVERGRVRQVSFENATSYAFATDAVVAVPGLGEVRYDLAYGGLWYAVVDASSLGLAITLDQVHRLMALSEHIRAAINASLPEHPDEPDDPTFVPQLLWTTTEGTRSGTNLATSTQLGFDRSPCGTGSSARTAILHAAGALAIGDTFNHHSVLGTTFTTEVVRKLVLPSGRPAITPEVTGSAWITARSELVFRDDDPLADGSFVPPFNTVGR